MGEITLEVPQVCEGGFYPGALEKGQPHRTRAGDRSERALTLALAEMYVQGVSTRKVTVIVEQLYGSIVSSLVVSRAAKLLDETLEDWHNGPLGEFPTFSWMLAMRKFARQARSMMPPSCLLWGLIWRVSDKSWAFQSR
jgi:putative transposase